MSFQRKFRKRLVLAFQVIALPCVAAEVRYVDASAAPPGNGTSWCTAFTDLQDALSASSEGDEIRVANGRYVPDRGGGQSVGDRNATFRLISGVVLRGGYAGCDAANPGERDWVANETILDGDLLNDDLPSFVNRADNVFHVVSNNVADSTAVLDGFTIRGGYANGTLSLKTDQGSGLHNHSGVSPLFNSRPIVRNCLFRDNWAINHGAVNDHGGLTLTNCEFRDNYAGLWGGGLYIHESLSTVVSDCRFYNNHTDGVSGGGGGVVNEGDSTFTNCLFSGNTSAMHGGGMYNHGQASPTLVGCTFFDNEAAGGGAMYNVDQSAPTLTNCLFDSNRATAQFPEDRLGGAMYNSAGTLPILIGCIFSNNTAFYGGAMYNEGVLASLTNCQFLANRTPTIYYTSELNAAGQAIYPGGGAIYSTAACDVTLTNVLFDGNRSSQYGGAIYGNPGLIMTLNGCAFSGNDSYWGSVFMSGAVMSISDCEFRNGSGFYGGAMTLAATQATIKECLFIDNEAGRYCGGALNFMGSPSNIHVANSMFFGNFAEERGGAICMNSVNVTLANCVFSGNSTLGAGGAIERGRRGSASNSVLSNCTFSGNTAVAGASLAMDNDSPQLNGTNNVVANNCIFRDGPNPVWDDQGQLSTLAITYSNVEGGWPGTGNIDLPAMFVDANGLDGLVGTEDDDLRLLSDSPCFDAGDSGALPADTNDLDGDGDMGEPIPLDLDGYPRIRYSNLDMGAYENWGTDCNANAIPDDSECLATVPPMPDPDGFAKNRYLSFMSPNPCQRTAIRVKLVSLHHVDPPYTSGPSVPFSPFEGQIRWVGPPSTQVESGASPLPWNAAALQCTPHFMDWSEVGLIHVTGTEIVPSSNYEVAFLAEGCNQTLEGQYSTALAIQTARWGDVVVPFQPPALSQQPDFTDVSALVNKFRSAPGAPSKARALLAGNPPNPVADLSFEHISACIDAFRGRQYPYLITLCP